MHVEGDMAIGSAHDSGCRKATCQGALQVFMASCKRSLLSSPDPSVSLDQVVNSFVEQLVPAPPPKSEAGLTAAQNPEKFHGIVSSLSLHTAGE